MAAFALERESGGFAQVNVTPLVDVMLVLLVIFMLSVPQLKHKLAFDFSHCSVGCPAPSDPVRLSIKQTGELYWNGIALNRAELERNFAVLARQAETPVLTLRPEARTKYETVAAILAAAKNAGLRSISLESAAAQAQPASIRR